DPLGPVVDALRAGIGGTAPEARRMPAPSAAALLLEAVALGTLNRPGRRRSGWPQAYAAAAGAMALVTLVAYVFERAALLPLAPLTAMSPLAAAGLLLLSIGILLARPDQGLLQPFGSRGPGGTLARRLAPTLVLLPFGVALLSAAVIRVGLGQPGVALSLSTALFVLLLMVVLGGTVRALDDADTRRQAVVDELAGERDFVATLLQSLSDAVVVYDHELRVIDVNPRCLRLFARTREELIGVRPPYPWERGPESSPALAADGDDTGDRYVYRPDGSHVPVLAALSPVVDATGRPRAFVSTYVDITERKRAEDALAERAAALEQANERLLGSNRQLEEAAEFKRDLMSMVSHEVSQPLSSVASLSELLATDWADLPDDTRLELAEKIDKNTRRLTGMINDMLLLFRLDAGAVSARRASVPVGEVVDTVTDSLPATAGIVTSVDPDLCALVDRAHLWQVLSNLVANAVKYGAPPVEITTDPRPDGVVVISVRDHGPGIAAEHLPNLFDRIGRRGADGAKTARGSGLGLFIVRHLVEVNGGTVRYEHAEPNGARLAIELPRAAQPVADKLPSMQQ
ncbi:MAG TPA: PAS domain-containing sensor histidine kinase, partial [Pilimelia sp.]|nr:PAS domain-containing sensor histidine kinase [Pilimelia sp.]